MLPFLQWKCKKYYTFRECLFVPLGILREVRMLLFTCGISDCTIFFHIISQTAGFIKKITEYKMCGFIFSTILYERFCIIRRIERFMIKTVHRSSREVPLYLCGFSET